MVNKQYCKQASRKTSILLSFYMLSEWSVMSRPLPHEQCYALPPSAACPPINLSHDACPMLAA